MGGVLVVGSRLAPDPAVERIARYGAWLLKAWFSVPGVLIVLGVLGITWLVAARGVPGRLLPLWLLAPALWVVACLCIAGPGRLIPKEPFEGPVILRLARKDAVTALDLVGLACAALATLLAGGLLVWRLARKRYAGVSARRVTQSQSSQ